MKKCFSVYLPILSLLVSSLSWAGGQTLESVKPISHLPSSHVPEVGEVILVPDNWVALVVKDRKKAAYGHISYLGLKDYTDGSFYPKTTYQFAKPTLSNIKTVEYGKVTRAVPLSKGGLGRGDSVENGGRVGIVYFVFNNDKLVVKWTHKDALALDKFAYFELVDAAIFQSASDSPKNNLGVSWNDPYTALPAGTQVQFLKPLKGSGVAWVQNGAQFVSEAAFVVPAEGVYCAFSNEACFTTSAPCGLGVLTNNAHFLGTGSQLGLQCWHSKGLPVTYGDLLAAVGSLVTFSAPDAR